ncbi:hypothetical protein HPDFL43_00035730 [Hoeflea phototrophica DFL-43]|jgi:hypothetical protein|uniref:Uncharacterized protein n=1 Tax=Hoeflea phototrophica (strain DSM 17068 / NCIMB 14078 / DFL-43) TaxID=411684 RepID=A0A095BDZ9_HOEPD|nr:hypothetical protein HPDFL43_00035730 [Hoeflea phototrophica DFL-43]
MSEMVVLWQGIQPEVVDTGFSPAVSSRTLQTLPGILLKDQSNSNSKL